jgi:hypothetical protein
MERSSESRGETVRGLVRRAAIVSGLTPEERGVLCAFGDLSRTAAGSGHILGVALVLVRKGILTEIAGPPDSRYRRFERTEFGRQVHEVLASG